MRYAFPAHFTDPQAVMRRGAAPAVQRATKRPVAKTPGGITASGDYRGSDGDVTALTDMHPAHLANAISAAQKRGDMATVRALSAEVERRGPA